MVTTATKLAEVAKAKQGCQCERCQRIASTVLDALLDQMLDDRAQRHAQVVAKIAGA